MCIDRKTRIFAFVAVLNAGILLISNLVAAKIWSLGSLPFDGGFILFPLTYIIGDIANEIFGKQPSRWIASCGVALNILAVLTFTIVTKLPAYPGWENQGAFETIFGFVPRVIIGSLAAYFVSTILDINLFDKIRQSQHGSERMFYARALGSSVIARFVDSIVFETIAFFGVLSVKEFFIQAFAAYAGSMALEVILFPFTSCIVRISQRYLFPVSPKKTAAAVDYEGKH